MRHKTTQAIFDYWDNLRHEREAPLRSEIEPSDIRSSLPDLFIIEHGSDGSLNFRLAGTRICLLLGREVTRQSFSSLWAEESVATSQKVGYAVLAKKCPAILTLNGQTTEGQTMAVEMLLLPVYSREDHCDRIFGSMVGLSRDVTIGTGLAQLSIDELNFIGPTNRSSILKNRIELTSHKSVARSEGSALGQIFTKIMHLKVFEGGRRD